MPADRKTALKFLDNFLLTKFSLFGDYEDALSSEHDFLFHSALSPILNLGLITPAELLSRVKKYQNKIKYNVIRVIIFIEKSSLPLLILFVKNHSLNCYLHEFVYVPRQYLAK